MLKNKLTECNLVTNQNSDLCELSAVDQKGVMLSEIRAREKMLIPRGVFRFICG